MERCCLEHHRSLAPLIGGLLVHSSAIRFSKDSTLPDGGTRISKPASASDGCKFITKPWQKNLKEPEYVRERKIPSIVSRFHRSLALLLWELNAVKSLLPNARFSQIVSQGVEEMFAHSWLSFKLWQNDIAES
ncbi:hypothetical protein V6N12_042107 [Hibiscus sabdariffa]|uniref:Uncharacterized protein n=1 Tax=Hibiscus sabdariffa TaxID=183260 RepID=A0ABR2EDT7_9ROSI